MSTTAHVPSAGQRGSLPSATMASPPSRQPVIAPPAPPPPRPPPGANKPSRGKESPAAAKGLSNGHAVAAVAKTVSSTPVPAAATTAVTTTSTPLKAAADLIQTLDIAHSQVTSSAADAAKECETARNNARAAHEICRRYQSRSFPELKSTFGGSNNSNYDDDNDFASSLWGIDGGCRRHVALGRNHYSTDHARTPKHRSVPNRHRNNMDDGAAAHDVAATTPQEYQTPKANSDSTKPSNAPPSSRGSSNTATTNRLAGLQTPSSVDRIAQNHAEDIMQLSMELERTKQAFKSEQRMHQECKAAILSLRSEMTTLQNENQTLRQELEEEQKKEKVLIPQLQEDLETARLRLLEAEEDADMAVDFAKDGEKERSELAISLDQAKREIWHLKQQLQLQEQRGGYNGGKRVHFADDMPSTGPEGEGEEKEVGTPLEHWGAGAPRGAPSPSMVAAGRQILRNTMTKSSEENILLLERSPSKSAERRRRLQVSLNRSNGGGSSSLPTPTRLSLSPARPSQQLNHDQYQSTADASIKKKLDECHAAARILQTSGRRLNLDGLWFKREPSSGLGLLSPSSSSSSSISVPLDAMARQYCQSCEYKIDHQEQEISKLESLCDLMEKQLIHGDGNNGNNNN